MMTISKVPLLVVAMAFIRASAFTGPSSSYSHLLTNTYFRHLYRPNLYSMSNDEESDSDRVENNPVYQYHQDPNDNLDQALDISTITHLLHKRSEYKKKSNFEKADSIRDYLQSQYGVSVNDKTRIWSTQWKANKKKKFSSPSQNKKQQFSKKKNESWNQQQGKGYQQVGGSLDSSQCQLTKQDINELLKERTRARRERNFQKSDAILQQLRMERVFVDDTLKLWRADGLPFSNASKGSNSANPKTYIPYRKASNSREVSKEEEAYIQQKVNERVEAKIQRDFFTADDIRDELRFLKHVEINDDDRTWAVVDEKENYFEQSLQDYEFGGKRNTNFPEDELQVITEKVRERMEARKKNDFDRADAILRELAVMHGVRVDDKKKLWHFDGSRAASERQRNDEQNDKTSWKKEAKEAKKKKHRPDWLIEEDALPEGISIVDESIPDGISLIDNSIPDGIAIVEEPSRSRNDLESLTVPDLKEKLLEVGLPTSGKKAELIDRLLQCNEQESLPDGIELPSGISLANESSLKDASILDDPNCSSDNNDELVNNLSYSKSDLESLTIPVLKEKLRDAGLPVTGRKADLIDRLMK